MMKKFILGIILAFLTFYISDVFADSYYFYYRDGCSHCAKVESYFEKNDTIKRYGIVEKNTSSANSDDIDELINFCNDFGIDVSDFGVPTIFVFDEEGKPKSCTIGDNPIIDFFDNLDYNSEFNNNSTVDTNSGSEENNSNTGNLDKNQSSISNFNENNNNSGETKTLKDRLSFFLVLLPAAISDSINPCEFAVIIILLGSILIKGGTRKKVIASGLAFSGAIFIMYFLLGLGIYKVLGNFSGVYRFKIIIGIIGIMVGLANLKDFFWYGRLFVMEVPFSWRKKMKKLLNKVTSPIGAFCVGTLVSLFLAPCTSGPYIVILGYLSSESTNLNLWGYIYLFIYNIFFVLPMLIITFIIAFGRKSVEELEEFRDSKIELIHLIVGFLMLILGIYIILDANSVFDKLF